MAAWPAVKAALAAGAQGLSAFADASVFIGPQATNDNPSKTFEVGYVNGEDNAGTYQRATAYDGSVWSEIGEVRSTIVAQTGDSDPSFAEANAFSMVDDLEAWIQANRTLGGVLSLDATVQTSVDVVSISNAQGTATELVLVLTYTTTT